MGHQTELILNATIRDDLPLEVKKIIDYLFNRSTQEPDVLPSHNFFECRGWRLIGSSYSAYHIPWSVARYSDNCIFTRCDFKNRDHMIEKFLDWLLPYIDYDDEIDTVIGWIKKSDYVGQQPKLIVIRNLIESSTQIK